MVPEPAARLHMFRFLEFEMISSRNAMSTKPRHVRRYLDTTVYTKLRKLCTADDADPPCEHSLRHGETIDVLPIAYFVVYPEILRAYDPRYGVKLLR